jgi:hypothetical protein
MLTLPNPMATSETWQFPVEEPVTETSKRPQ